MKQLALTGFAVLLIATTESCTVDGKIKQDGDTWCDIEPSGAWKTKPIGCMTPGGKRLNPGGMRTENNIDYECTRNANGMIKLNQRSTGTAMVNRNHNDGENTMSIGEGTCQHQGQSYKKNKTWRVGQFMMKCLVDPSGSWRTKVYACVTPGGHELAVGRSHNESGYRYRCSRTSDGSVRIHSETQ